LWTVELVEEGKEALLLASPTGRRPGAAVYNIGALEFGTMRETLQALVDHAQTGSRVRSLPVAPARWAMRSRASTGMSATGPL